MAQDRARTFQELDRLWGDPAIHAIAVDGGARLAILSDLHLGDGGDADDIRPNVYTVVAALEWYREQGYSLVLLGDVEELWQFELDQVEKRYDQTIYATLRSFPAGRVRRIFGNHDIEWQCPADPATGNSAAQGVPEAVKLADPGGRPFALLVHGHQGSLDSDRNSWISRFLVRGIWKTIEPLAARLRLYGHPSATKSMVVHDYEHVMYAWAKEKKVILICGHSHRAVCGSRPFSEELRNQIETIKINLRMPNTTAKQIDALKRELVDVQSQLDDEDDKGRDIGSLDTERALVPCYYNSGCGLYEDGNTAIELEGDDLRLVKWSNRPVGSRETLVSDHLSAVRDAVGC